MYYILCAYMCMHVYTAWYVVLAYCQTVLSGFNNSFWYEVSFLLFPFTYTVLCGFCAMYLWLSLRGCV